MFRVKNVPFLLCRVVNSPKYSLIVKNPAQMFETKNLENRCKIKTALHKQ